MPKTKFYLLTRKEPRYSLNTSLLIRAQNAREARKLAYDYARADRDTRRTKWSYQWLQPSHTTISQVKFEGPSEVVHADYYNG